MWHLVQLNEFVEFWLGEVRPFLLFQISSVTSALDSFLCQSRGLNTFLAPEGFVLFFLNTLDTCLRAIRIASFGKNVNSERPSNDTCRRNIHSWPIINFRVRPKSLWHGEIKEIKQVSGLGHLEESENKLYRQSARRI